MACRSAEGASENLGLSQFTRFSHTLNDVSIVCDVKIYVNSISEHVRIQHKRYKKGVTWYQKADLWLGRGWGVETPSAPLTLRPCS